MHGECLIPVRDVFHRHQKGQDLGHGSGIHHRLRRFFSQNQTGFHVDHNRVFTGNLCSDWNSFHGLSGGVHRLGNIFNGACYHRLWGVRFGRDFWFLVTADKSNHRYRYDQKKDGYSKDPQAALAHSLFAPFHAPFAALLDLILDLVHFLIGGGVVGIHRIKPHFLKLK